jgi:hypothetical protein
MAFRATSEGRLKGTPGMPHPHLRPQTPRLPPRRLWLAPGVLLAGLGLAGCSAFDALLHRGEVGPHAISLHHLADAGALPGNLTRVVADAGGTQQVCIRSAPIISNRQVRMAQIVETEDPNRPTVRLLLDRQGSMLWLQTCQEAPGDMIVVLLDGFLWHTLVLPRPTDTESILLEGRLGRSEAEAIVESTPRQYRRLNPSSRLF